MLILHILKYDTKYFKNRSSLCTFSKKRYIINRFNLEERGVNKLSEALCQTDDKAYKGCDLQSNKHTEQQKYELYKEYVKNGVSVKIHIPRLTEIQNEKRNTEIKDRIMRVIKKSVS